MKYITGAYTVRIQTKPYLAKYITANFGDPILISQDNLLGMIIISLLQKNFCTHQNLQRKHIVFRSLTAEVVCRIPYRYMYSYGFDMKDDHIIQLNRYFDVEFAREMHFYIQRNAATGRYKGYDQLMEQFVNQFGIIIDDHISFDALKKIEYRHRNFVTKIQTENYSKFGLSFPKLFPTNDTE